jgi:hypothetical protein
MIDTGTMESSSPDALLYHRKVVSLAERDSTPLLDITTPGAWEFVPYAPRNLSPEYTILNAPAFKYVYFPEGKHPGAPVIYVTYGIPNLENELAAIYENSSTQPPNTDSRLNYLINYYTNCDADAGYFVYHVNRPT